MPYEAVQTIHSKTPTGKSLSAAVAAVVGFRFAVAETNECKSPCNQRTVIVVPRVKNKTGAYALRAAMAVALSRRGFAPSEMGPN